MKILVSGASGLVGSATAAFLANQGHTVVALRRCRSGDSTVVSWDPTAGTGDPESFEGFDAVVHLAGDNVAQGRWNAAKKARIRDSRVRDTAHLCKILGHLKRPPRVLACASAIGYYGSRGDEILHEQSPAGSGFLAEVCRDWESATSFATLKGIRVVSLRIGMALSATGGALKKMLLPFRLGLGGKIGPGAQYMSWVSIDDLAQIIRFALENENLRGPVNAVSPDPVTNLAFTKTLGRVLRRPTVFPMPAFMARAAFGEMADALLLSSAKVEPRVLTQAGFLFRHDDLETALRDLLGKRS